MTHTHTCLTALCPGPSGWAGTRKVKPIRNLLKQETLSDSGIRWTTCKSAPRSRQKPCQHPTNHFLQTGCHLSGTTWVSRYQKGNTNLDFTEARDSELQWHHMDHMQVCTSLQSETMPAPDHSVFYRLDALPATQPTASKHWLKMQN